MARRLNRVAYKVEPKLHVHRYIVSISGLKRGEWKTKYFYCGNMKEVNALKSRVRRGGVMEVYSASHNFVRAWSR